MEDKQLVLRCKDGSTEALRRIYQKYRRDLLVLAIALLNDANAAEDVLHDVFVSFVRSLDRFQPTGSLKSYLATCVANRVRNLKASKHSQAVGLDWVAEASSDSDGPSASVISNEELQQLSYAMARLSYEQREVIMLRLQTGMRFKAIADSQGSSVNTVKSRYRYGLNKLRSILNSEVKK